VAALEAGGGQPIRLDGPESHLIRKKGTPTMGGFLILLRSASRRCCGPISATAMSGCAARHRVLRRHRFFDDYKKLTKRSSSGLSGRSKLVAEALVAAVAGAIVMHLTRDPLSTTLAVRSSRTC